MLAEAGNHGPVARERQTLAQKESLSYIEHRVVGTGSCELWQAAILQKLRPAQAAPRLLQEGRLLYGQTAIPSRRTLRSSGVRVFR